MKKKGVLNAHLSKIIAFMGHGDLLCIADAGLPVPNDAVNVDLALREGMPLSLDVLDTILEELFIEEVIVADEMKEKSPGFYNEIKKRFKNVKMSSITHNEMEEMFPRMKAIVRTGEFTPYANVVLKAGCVY